MYKYPFTLQCKCLRILSDSFSTLTYSNNRFVCTSVNTCSVYESNNNLRDLKDENNIENNLKENIKENKTKLKVNLNPLPKVLCVCGETVGTFYDNQYHIDSASVSVYTLGCSENMSDKNDENNVMTHNELCEEVDKLKRFCVWLSGKVKRKV